MLIKNTTVILLLLNLLEILYINIFRKKKPKLIIWFFILYNLNLYKTKLKKFYLSCYFILY